MGKPTILTPQQQQILEEFSRNEYLTSTFYFTGGTALAEVYLKHRLSDDLDFFTEQECDYEVLFQIVSKWSRTHNFTFTTRTIEKVNRFLLTFDDESTLMVDFVTYQQRLEPDTKCWNDIQIDSLRDIAVNKFITVQQRTDVKDFVDLYYLLKDFTIWTLSYGAEKKFRVEFEPLLFATDLLKIDEFEFLPKMKTDLQLEELRDFYHNLAKQLGLKSIE